MTGSGKSYTVGRIIERLVALNNGTVVVLIRMVSMERPWRRGN
ncbi:ATP-binding protein [Pseudomonas aeruginosa]|nr:ATP-binding protein [Pseudomonas aeruginosa]